LWCSLYNFRLPGATYFAGMAAVISLRTGKQNRRTLGASRLKQPGPGFVGRTHSKNHLTDKHPAEKTWVGILIEIVQCSSAIPPTKLSGLAEKNGRRATTSQYVGAAVTVVITCRDAHSANK